MTQERLLEKSPVSRRETMSNPRANTGSLAKHARLIAGLVGVCALASSGDASADPRCGPSALLAGGQELVGEVAFGLATRGIDVKPSSRCPTVHVTLARAEGEIVIELIDPAGRTIRRNVSRVEEAITVIESWARPDMNEDLLAGFEVPTVVVPAIAAASPHNAMSAETTKSSPDEPMTTILLAPPGSTRAMIELRQEQRSPLMLSIAGDFAIDRRTSWIGTTVTACLPVSRVCVGGTGHARTSRTVGIPAEGAVLATIDVPFHVRSFALIPGFGIGASREISAMTDGTQIEPVTWIPCAEARMVASYPLARWVFVDVMAGVAGAASTLDTQNQNQNQNGDNTSATGPTVWFQLGAGLRLGAP
jgi:hypothetical protein